ncbi:MAG: homoprotocatechuate degradation operon regulator HpaR [Candidatus Puniceispirillaceae bacterium]
MTRTRLPPTSRSLPIALMRAREGVMAPIRDMLSQTGMTEQQWRVLRVLDDYGQMDAKTLADHASLLLPSLTRIAATLCEKGYIIQKRDGKDRRRQMIEITTSGKAIIDDNAAKAAQIAADFKDVLGEANYEMLLDFLEILNPKTPS